MLERTHRLRVRVHSSIASAREDQVLTKVVKVRHKLDEQPPPTVELSSKLIEWYELHGRDFPWRSASSCYDKIIAELLLQRTQAVTVSNFYTIFLHEFPSWESLSIATESKLREFLKPIGLWRQRARMLHRLSRALAELDFKLPPTREELERLPGISQYMASAVLLLCYGRKEPLLDVNMARILERVYGPRKLADIRYDPHLQSTALATVNVEDPIAVNWAVMDLAATTCLRNAPKCFECPLADMCRFAKRLDSCAEVGHN